MTTYEQRLAALVRGGLRPDVAEWILGPARDELYYLGLKLCPDCMRSLTCTLDPRQVGGSAVCGLWYNYRCASCGYLADLIEPLETNDP